MLVLASASPRRRELLAQAGFSFRVIASDILEERLLGEAPATFAMRLAREKAQSVFDRHHDTLHSPGDPLLVLGADTVVVTAEEILGKPANPADAARMLRLLSGRTHQVITGICLISRRGAEASAENTAVAMRTLSDEEIAAYVTTGEPMDKAGAYAIQGYAARWIPRIEGDYFNVVGLPLARVASMIEEMTARTKRETVGSITA